MGDGDANARERLEASVRATLQDMLDSSTTCQCCDNASDHQALFQRACKRFPSYLWPVNTPGWMLVQHRDHPNGPFASTMQMLTDRK